MQCLRVCPNRDTGFSPSELDFRRNINTPLDILYCGWVENEVEGVEVEVLVEGLKERLGVWDAATAVGLREHEKWEDA